MDDLTEIQLYGAGLGGDHSGEGVAEALDAVGVDEVTVFTGDANTIV